MKGEKLRRKNLDYLFLVNIVGNRYIRLKQTIIVISITIAQMNVSIKSKLNLSEKIEFVRYAEIFLMWERRVRKDFAVLLVKTNGNRSRPETRINDIID